MRWFDQADAEFFNLAADPAWRAMAAKKFARGSAFHFWPIVIATALNVFALWIPDGLIPALPVAMFRTICWVMSISVIHWAIMYAQFESYLLVLKYIDSGERKRLTDNSGASMAEHESGALTRSMTSLER